MVVLGIDIGKRELFANLQESDGSSIPQVLGHQGPISNTSAGFQQLVEWLQRRVGDLRQVRVVMEATSVYWEQCAYHFHALGCPVSIVNPAQIRYFSRSVLRRGKTDAMDAEIIARYGHVMHPAGWVPPRTVFSDLKQLTRERERVQLHLLQEHNHLTTLQDAQQVSGTVLALAQRRIDLLERQVVELEDALHALIDTDVSLKQQLTLLLSVSGYGFITAVTVLAETAGFSMLETGSEISAAAGVAPAPNQSGASNKRGSISKTGNPRLRRIAYLAALGATRSNSRMKVFYQGLKVRGKPPKVALIALGRKLLRTGLAVVKSGKPYQDDFSRAQDGSGSTPHPAVQGG